MFRKTLLEEPFIRFGDGLRARNPRFGIIQYGPYSPIPARDLHVGVLGEQRLLGQFEAFWTLVVNPHQTTGYRGFQDTFGLPLKPELSQLRNEFTAVGFGDVADRIVEKAS